MRNGRAIGMRWLGVGLASGIAVLTIGLWLTGRLALYINPDSSWWAVSMAFLLLFGAIASCAVPVRDDEHEHAETLDVEIVEEDASGHVVSHEPHAPRRRVSPVGVIAGALATGFVALALVLPPASLSAELALARSSGAPPVLAGSATLALAASDDTSSFGIGEWASVLATTTDPSTFVGEPATLVGFVAPGEDGAFQLSRLVIVHCVIDAQVASVPVAGDADGMDVGQWVEVQGEYQRNDAGALVLEPTSVVAIDEPGDPYEY